MQTGAGVRSHQRVGVAHTFRGAVFEKLRHTLVMRRVAWLVLLAVVGAVVGVASARAGGTGTTTTSTTTTGTTASTTATTPSFAPLSLSSLPAGCVGAGAAALVLPSRRVIALGTPASNLGPSAYPSSGSVLAFDSSASSGSTCRSAGVSLGSVSLFDGVVTAGSVQATDGKGTTAGLTINGSAVTVAAGGTVPVDGWGQLTLGATVGRVTAPLVLRLLQAHGSLPAGTAVVVAFAASAQSTAKPRPVDHRQARAQHRHATGPSRSRKQRLQPTKPPPDYPASSFPFRLSGGLADTAQDNPVVSTAMRYLGVPYRWGGASPTTGFDCSGLVMYVFAQLGVPLPHYAAAQWHTPDGVWVAPNRLQPGDLVFFTGSDGTRKAPGHVGIYVGDGYLIDAPHTGSFVRIDSLNEPKFANQYVGARQIVSHLRVTRHLLGVTQARASLAEVDRLFPLQIKLGAIGGLSTIATAGTAASRHASRDYAVWVSAALGGLLLMLGVGALAFRRRHASEAVPSSDLSN